MDPTDPLQPSMTNQAMPNPQVMQMLQALAGAQQNQQQPGMAAAPGQGMGAAMGAAPTGADPYSAMMSPPPMTPPPAPIF